MREKFKDIMVDGTISIKLKGTDRVWEASKPVIMKAIVDVAQAYQSQGYKLTLRQLYYQLVAKDMIPNHDTVYKKLSALKDDCVYGGYVDWAVFEDRGRVPKIAYFEDDIKGALERAADYYKLDRQLGQEKHIEVWTEKDAISDILKRVTDPLTIRLVINKGYSSSTAMYGAYERFIKAIAKGKRVKILYFGDHDPSGLDMVRDITDRILFFMKYGASKSKTLDLVDTWLKTDEFISVLHANMNDTAWWLSKKDEDPVFDYWRAFFESHFEVRHIGLTMEQIELYRPPHNPAKITDPRAKNYVEQFGERSWEVDALSPDVMTEIVTDAIWEEMDADVYEGIIAKEESDVWKLKGLLGSLPSE
jgi:hypothetical protein